MFTLPLVASRLGEYFHATGATTRRYRTHLLWRRCALTGGGKRSERGGFAGRPLGQ